MKRACRFRQALLRLPILASDFVPAKFKIDTPVGIYNPDWAIIKHEAGQDRVYMVRETKSTDDRSKRRPTENAKIDAAKAHFEAIGVGDYAVSVPGNWRV